MLSSSLRCLTRSLAKPASMGCLSLRSKHTLPDLPYDFNALEPYISAEIMHLHHQKHHATYVNNLNAAEEQFLEAQQKGELAKMIALQSVINFNGGGHINHSIFWQNLSPKGGGTPDGDLRELIEASYGSFENMKDILIQRTVAIQGSGWGWLGYDVKASRVRLEVCPNQDPLFPTRGIIPLLGIDVWEHAYYLQYKNVRADYVKALFNIVNWKDVAQRLVEARAQL